jgi:hypothetical protein
MERMMKRLLRLAAMTTAVTVSIALGLPLDVNAVPLTLDNLSTPTFQQQTNNPCVIGNNSCQQPAGFTFTLLTNAASATVSSPSYTVGQIRTLVGNTFFIGIDVTQAQGQVAYSLTSFDLNINGGSPEFTYTGPTTLVNNHPGNGFSDALLMTFDLTGFPDDQSAVFTTSYTGGNAGKEQYFLISSSAPPATVPEPTTLLLWGTTMAGLGLVRWRRRKQTS